MTAEKGGEILNSEQNAASQEEITGDLLLFDDAFIDEQRAMLALIEKEQQRRKNENAPSRSRDTVSRSGARFPPVDLGDEYILNDTLIEEQYRILQDFERQKSFLTLDTDLTTSTGLSQFQVEANELEEVARREKLTQIKHARKPHHNPSTKSSLRSMREVVDVIDTQDYTETSVNNHTIRIKGTKHAYDAIRRGKATLVQCPSCQTLLQIARKSKNLYCTICHQITPTKLSQLDDSSSRFEDSHVASTMQWQEIDAKVLKTGK